MTDVHRSEPSYESWPVSLSLFEKVKSNKGEIRPRSCGERSVLPASCPPFLRRVPR